MRKKFLINLGVFLIIISIYFLPRLLHLDKRIGFGWDQESYAGEIKKMITDRKFTLIGPRTNNVKGFFIGPYFLYLLAPFYYFSYLHPLSNMYFIVFYNILFFFVTFYIVKKIMGFKFSMLFLIVWSFNNVLVEYDTYTWNPLLIPLGVMLLIYSLYLIYKKGKWRNWILFGLISGLFINIHVEFIFPLCYALTFIGLYLRKKHTEYKKMFLALIVFTSFFIPLFIFDFRHDFLNTKLFLRFFTESDPKAISHTFAWTNVLGNILQPLFGFQESFIMAIGGYLVILVLFIYQYFKAHQFFKLHYFSSIILWLSIPIIFSLYGKRPSEYYFNFIYPFVYIAFLDCLVNFKYKFLFPFFLGFYIALNLPYINMRTTPPGISLYTKDAAIKYIKEKVGGKKCDIAFNVPLGMRFGFDYLIDYYGIGKVGDWKTCVVNVNIPPQHKGKIFGDVEVVLPKKQ